MTQFDTDSDYDDDPDSTDGGGNAALRKKLKDAERRAREAESRAESNSAAARRIAFLDAGIPDTPQSRFFLDKYDGDFDPEVIKAQAIEYGFLTDDDHSDELAAVASQADAAAQAQGPTVTGSQEDYEAEIEAAVRNSERGKEAYAIDQVVQRWNHKIG
jgi:hypothetical protein